MSKKMIAGLLAVVLVLTTVIGGTLAWLSAKTPDVVNTFTVGDIKLELKEHDGNQEVTNREYTHVKPGDKLDKDPFVRVTEGSEACYVYVKVVAANNFVNDKQIVSYPVNTNWTQVTTNDGSLVYRYNNIVTTDKMGDTHKLYILDKNQVTINDKLTKDDFEAIRSAGAPTLTFTAAAVQSDNIGGEAKADVEALALLNAPVAP